MERPLRRASREDALILLEGHRHDPDGQESIHSLQIRCSHLFQTRRGTIVALERPGARRLALKTVGWLGLALLVLPSLGVRRASFGWGLLAALAPAWVPMGAILLHELSHLAVARSQRLEVKVLFVGMWNGWVLHQASGSETWRSLRTVAAGPLCDLAIAATGWTALRAAATTPTLGPFAALSSWGACLAFSGSSSLLKSMDFRERGNDGHALYWGWLSRRWPCFAFVLWWLFVGRSPQDA